MSAYRITYLDIDGTTADQHYTGDTHGLQETIRLLEAGGAQQLVVMHNGTVVYADGGPII